MTGIRHLLLAAWADLVRRAGRAGRYKEAASAYAQALALASNQAEPHYLSRRLTEVRDQRPAME